MSQAGFWDNRNGESQILGEYKFYRQIRERYQNLQERLREAQEFSFLIHETDPEFPELKKEAKSLVQEAEDLKIQLLFSEAEDSHNAIVTIHSGAGGVESQDWVEMLFVFISVFVKERFRSSSN